MVNATMPDMVTGEPNIVCTNLGACLNKSGTSMTPRPNPNEIAIVMILRLSSNP
ncbi:hypothetical protein SAMN04488244_10840 [Vibrio hangzhouensis]|uniref:Uncharacterized protein n=1 Tax=Vibrio hangzhouensis TaxID=462991 RepID=A0A1H5XY96_9VIBR|nr:hypothetical protein SAMN04488244_10840 [Vibrio hangzhouensis]